jgi:hypothetical protein
MFSAALESARLMTGWKILNDYTLLALDQKEC